MEILIIFLLITGLLVGWFFLMRDEILTCLQRLFESTKAINKDSEQSQTHVVRVSVRHTQTPPTIERKSAGPDDGIPRWTINE